MEGDRTARMVGKALSVLNPKERMVIEYTFGLKGRKLEPPEIAETSGLRLQDVKNALKSAMEKMKEEFGQNK